MISVVTMSNMFKHIPSHMRSYAKFCRPSVAAGILAFASAVATLELSPSSPKEVGLAATDPPLSTPTLVLDTAALPPPIVLPVVPPVVVLHALESQVQSHQQVQYIQRHSYI